MNLTLVKTIALFDKYISMFMTWKYKNTVYTSIEMYSDNYFEYKYSVYHWHSWNSNWKVGTLMAYTDQDI